MKKTPFPKFVFPIILVIAITTGILLPRWLGPNINPSLLALISAVTCCVITFVLLLVVTIITQHIRKRKKEKLNKS